MTDHIEELLALINQIKPVDETAMRAAVNHWDNIAKPIGGLGLLEDYIVRIAGIQGRADVDIDKKNIVVMCADNGVVEEGISQSGMEVTAVVADNIADGIASVNRMAARAGADVTAVDIGVAHPLRSAHILRRKVAPGTRNFLRGAAMTEQEMVRAVTTGIDLVQSLQEKGYVILGTGEMGIGNTTTSSALAAALLHMPVEQVTGRGAGLTREGLERKIQVISQGLSLHQQEMTGPLQALSCLGGLDIAGLTGVFLGGAIYRVPVVIDGLISAVAALIAARCNPLAAQYMLPSHMGKEPAMEAVMAELSLQPIIYGRLALGEGTGAALLFPMLDMAHKVYEENSTFEDVQIDAYEKYD